MKTSNIRNALRYGSLCLAPPPDGIDLWDEDTARSFELAGERCQYRAWSGEQIPDQFIAIDTETVYLADRLNKGEIPQLVIAQASGRDPAHNYIVHPKDLARFIGKHRDRHLVFFNVAFDLAVMEKELAGRGKQKAVEALWEIIDAGRCHDLMLLDQLVRIAEGRAPFHQRSLADVAEELLGVELEKEDSPRQHYDTLLRKNHKGIRPEFYEYAVKDSRATLLAFGPLWEKAWEIHNTYVRVDSNEADMERSLPWGPLTEQIQVRAALALGWMSSEGVRASELRLEQVISEAQGELYEAIDEFEADGTVNAFQSENGGPILCHAKDGNVQFTEKGAPSKSIKLVRKLFKELCEKHEVSAPTTRKGLISTARDDYVGLESYEMEQTFEKYFRLQDLVSYLNKAKDLLDHITQDGCIHTRYITLVKTGRATSHSPQIQNLPREGRVRGCIVPREGHIFYGVDYSAIELAALASICRHRYGYSKLGDRIDHGEDPHAYTASQIIDKQPADVTKDERQAAKVYNFGVPGGMGVKALAHQAKVMYGIEMTEEEAGRWREKLVREVYPEIGEFLDDHLDRFIFGVLSVPVEEVVEDLVEATEADSFSPNAREWILQSVERALRAGLKANGEPYDAGWMEKLWQGLRKAYSLSKSVMGRNEGIEKALKDCVTGKSIARLFFPTRAVTLTGRVWSDVNYRQAHNAQLQGLAADGARLALYRLVREGYRPIIFVHDEVILEIPDDKNREAVARQIDAIMIDEMQRVINDVSIRVEGRFMERWKK